MVYDYYKEQDKKSIKSYKGRILIAIVVLLLLAVAIIASNIYTEIIELNEIGNYSSVYTRNLMFKIIAYGVNFFLISLVLIITNIYIKRNIKVYLKEIEKPYKKLPNLLISIPIALIAAFLSKDIFPQKALNFLNATKFGKTDPLYSVDIGYYVFQRPFFMAIYDFMFVLWIFVIFYTTAYYLLVLLSVHQNLTIENLKIKGIIRHNLINIAILFIIKSISYRFMKESILYSNVVNVNGAGYVDVNVWLNYFKLAPFLLLVIIIFSFIFILTGKLKKAAISIAVFPAVWVIVTITAVTVQGFVVKPNEANLESKYLKYNIQKTREAYNLNNIEVANFDQIQEFTPEILNRNIETKNNIRIVDYKPTLDSNIQLQGNTAFYTFADGDIINYTVNGRNIPVFITAREISKNNLPEKSYINTMFKYTHGYGVVINPINKITAEGQVETILSGLRMNSTDPSIKVNQPRIYYGELTKDPVIVNPGGNLKEIDYDGSSESETTYSGSGGIKLNMLNRLLYSIKYGDQNLIISGYVKSDSRLLLNRDIINRAQKPVPFLTVDKDPYILIDSEGRLKWVLDAYTTTSYYPYSQNYNAAVSFNYIRNSVKIVIDAYDGTVKYYIIDKDDPIIKTYDKTYPELFTKGELPQDIKSHMRYPEYLFKLQSELLERYHIDPETDADAVQRFYTNQDMWDVAKYQQYGAFSGSIAADNGAAGVLKEIEPYYNMIQLPAGMGNEEELILMRPFTPAQKNNMSSWMAVKNSYDEYGRMILFMFTKNTNIFGPNQVEVKINQIDTVSKDMTLWGQSGSNVFKGSLLVIPIENSILYVEPIYIQSSDTSSIPEVREIVVGCQKGDEFKYGIGANMDQALNDLFGIQTQTPSPTGTNVQTPPTGTGVLQDQKLINDIMSKYDALTKQLDELGKLIGELRE